MTLIEINLARQLRCGEGHKASSWLVWWLVYGVMVMGVGMVSWWWTQSLQQQVDGLRQERMITIQTLRQMQEKLKSTERYDEQRRLLVMSLERIRGQEKEKAWPVVLLDGISKGLNELEIWLERVQFEGPVVELQGQSLGLEDIGHFIEVLENDQIIMSAPVVEILDGREGDSEVFPFMIRFVLAQRIT
jgi:Tfp pilus assembly protein PilN